MNDQEWDDLYNEANRKAQEACDQCDSRRHYTCTYHEGWADGYEAASKDAIDRQE